VIEILIVVPIYIFLLVLRKVYLKERFSLFAVIVDWWRLFKRSWQVPVGWDGENIYEKLVYWLLGIPILLLFVLLAAYILSLFR